LVSNKEDRSVALAEVTKEFGLADASPPIQNEQRCAALHKHPLQKLQFSLAVDEHPPDSSKLITIILIKIS
jgi:hypothetical protein